MKIIYNLTFILAVIISACIGCLVIFNVIAFDQGLDYLFKSLATIVLLGASSAAVSFVTTKNKSNESDK